MRITILLSDREDTATRLFRPTSFSITLIVIFYLSPAGDNMNIFLNENWKDLLKEFGPPIGDALGTIMKNTLESVSDLVPYEFIFPLS